MIFISLRPFIDYIRVLVALWLIDTSKFLVIWLGNMWYHKHLSNRTFICVYVLTYMGIYNINNHRNWLYLLLSLVVKHMWLLAHTTLLYWIMAVRHTTTKLYRSYEVYILTYYWSILMYKACTSSKLCHHGLKSSKNVCKKGCSSCTFQLSITVHKQIIVNICLQCF